MRRKQSQTGSLDGFVVRRGAGNSSNRLGVDNVSVPERFLNKNTTQSPAPTLTPSSSTLDAGVTPDPRDTGKDNISEILRQLPGDETEQKAKKRRFRITKKGLKRFGIVCGIIVLLIGGYLAIKFILASGRVFDGNIFTALFSDAKPLKTDQYGRANILLFGTSEDDPGHEGGDLTDSIMIASIDPKTKNGFLLSVPRDLWVKYGRACDSGYEGKINAVYQCGKGQKDDEKAGAEMLKGVVSKNFGLDIQYYTKVNYTALKDAVNAVGGITVNIDSDDPRGILDRNFDWKCKYKCYYVKHPNGPAKLDGEHALALARARNASGGYGLGGGNFDREGYQQKIIIAIRDKAMSAGVLANPVKVNGLIDTVGKNVRTNFEAGEVKSLVKLAQETDSNKLKQLTLVDEKKPLVTTGNHSGQSIVRPVDGVYDFSSIKAYVKMNLSGDTALLEGAVIDVLNGSGVVGAAQKKADELELGGFTVGIVSNAPKGSYGAVSLYDLSGGKKPGTKAKLEKQLGVTSQSSLPSGVSSDADFVIIVGSNGTN